MSLLDQVRAGRATLSEELHVTGVMLLNEHRAGLTLSATEVEDLAHWMLATSVKLRAQERTVEELTAELTEERAISARGECRVISLPVLGRVS